VAALYGELAQATQSPVVELNRAVALAESGLTEPALALVEGLTEQLADYQYFHATRAELLVRLGRPAEARKAFERALALAHTEPEQRFLKRRIAEI
jgi:RNA polymerase sigma-70 factor (ECF subfamily)